MPLDNSLKVEESWMTGDVFFFFLKFKFLWHTLKTWTTKHIHIYNQIGSVMFSSSRKLTCSIHCPKKRCGNARKLHSDTLEGPLYVGAWRFYLTQGRFWLQTVTVTLTHHFTYCTSHCFRSDEDIRNTTYSIYIDLETFGHYFSKTMLLFSDGRSPWLSFFPVPWGPYTPSLKLFPIVVFCDVAFSSWPRLVLPLPSIRMKPRRLFLRRSRVEDATILMQRFFSVGKTGFFLTPVVSACHWSQRLGCHWIIECNPSGWRGCAPEWRAQ